jgi:paraquat-inducible protein B
MNGKPNDFKIGLFVLVALALAMASVFVFGASKWFQKKIFQETYVDENVTGLKIGAPVTLRGVTVGVVTKIDFTWNIYHVAEPRYVYIEFAIHDKTPIALPGADVAEVLQREVESGLRARVKSQGLAAGTVIVSLEYLDPKQHPPLPFPWKPRHGYIPAARGEFAEVVSKVDTLVGNLNKINFQKIGTLVEDDLMAGNRVLTEVDKINFHRIGTNADLLVSDLRDVATRLKALAGNTNGYARTNLQTITADADALIERVQQTIGRVDQAVGRIDQTVGAVDVGLINESLENLHRATRELKETITNIKQYPAGAILGRPPEPARSVERPRR